MLKDNYKDLACEIIAHAVLDEKNYALFDKLEEALEKLNEMKGE